METPTLANVLASAILLAPADREALETYLRAMRRAGLELEPGSVLASSDADLRELMGVAA